MVRHVPKKIRPGDHDLLKSCQWVDVPRVPLAFCWAAGLELWLSACTTGHRKVVGGMVALLHLSSTTYCQD